MGNFRLQTKFLFSLILVGVGLTAGTLFVARQTAERQVRLQIFQDLRNSVYTFHNVQRDREQTLVHFAELMADVPLLKSLMTGSDAATIQDVDRRNILQPDKIERNQSGQKVIVWIYYPADKTPDGDYSLTLRGATKSGGYEDIEGYTFHVTRQR